MDGREGEKGSKESDEEEVMPGEPCMSAWNKLMHDAGLREEYLHWLQKSAPGQDRPYGGLRLRCKLDKKK